MKKLFYLFVMIAGLTLASVNVNAEDTKGKEKATTACCKSGEKAACTKSGEKAACCKSGDKAEAKKCCSKEAASCTKKEEPKK